MHYYISALPFFILVGVNFLMSVIGMILSLKSCFKDTSNDLFFSLMVTISAFMCILYFSDHTLLSEVAIYTIVVGQSLILSIKLVHMIHFVRNNH